MRHRRKLKKLNRDTKHRQALFRNQLKQLVIYGSITTTKAKAKQLKRLMDKVVYKAKTDSVASRRNLHRLFGDRRVVRVLVNEIAPLFKERVSGFTTVTQVGVRKGDNSQMVKVSFIKQRENLGSLKLSRQKPTAKKAKARSDSTKKSSVKTTKETK